ncbi:MAG: hypothetical protein M5R42_07655 [Rhodocyclaceae bacterium]|nr:hypothetical protein [Rhodocyclaceae bacterium]
MARAGGLRSEILLLTIAVLIIRYGHVKFPIAKTRKAKDRPT